MLVKNFIFKADTKMRFIFQNRFSNEDSIETRCY